MGCVVQFIGVDILRFASGDRVAVVEPMAQVNHAAAFTAERRIRRILGQVGAEGLAADRAPWRVHGEYSTNKGLINGSHGQNRGMHESVSIG